MGVDRATFYDAARIAIAPMGFCFPGLDAKGGDLPPRRECAPAWRDGLLALMPQVELVLVIGQYAQKWHLADAAKAGVTATVRGWNALWETDRRPRVLALPHPSWRNTGWLKRNPWFGDEVLPMMRAEVARLL